MSEKLKRIDYLGALTLVSGIALFLLGTSIGGNERPWDSPLVYGSILGAVGLIICFVIVEKYVARQPVSALLWRHLRTSDPNLQVMPLAVLFTRTPGFVSLTNWFM